MKDDALRHAMEEDAGESDRVLKDNLRRMRAMGTGGKDAAEIAESLASRADAVHKMSKGSIRARGARPKDLYRLMAEDPRQETEQSSHVLNIVKRGNEGLEDIGMVAAKFDEVYAKMRDRREKGFVWTLDVLIKLTDDHRRIRVFSTILATPHYSRVAATGLRSVRQLEVLLDDRRDAGSVIVDAAKCVGLLDDWGHVTELVSQGKQNADKLNPQHNVTVEGLLRLIDRLLTTTHTVPGMGTLPAATEEGDPEVAFHFERAISFHCPYSHLRDPARRAEVASWVQEFIDLTQDRTRYYDPETGLFYPDLERASRTRKEGTRTTREALS